MADFIVMAIVILLLAFAIAYIVKAKRSGAKCIGCPASGSCSRHISKPVKKSKDREKGRLIIGAKTVKIRGMHCENCRKSAEKALNSIDGIKATVDLEKGEAKIIAEAVDENIIKDAIEELGFTVEDIA